MPQKNTQLQTFEQPSRAPSPPHPETKKIALALGGGSARGWAHIGVIRELEKAGIRPHIITGTSAGALVGGAYAAGHLDRLEEFARSLRWKDILGFLDPTLGSGLFRGKKLFRFFYKYAPDILIEDLPMKFAATATDLTGGQEIWLQSGSLGDAIRASISLPGLLTPVKQNNRWLVDGGLVNPVPVSLARAMGADIIIAVELTSFAQFGSIGIPDPLSGELEKIQKQLTEKKRNLFDTIRDFLQRQKKSEIHADRHGKDKKPTILDVVSHSTFIMQSRITRSRLAVEPPEILLTPAVNQIGLMEFHSADRIIQAGKESVVNSLPTLKALIKEPQPSGSGEARS